MSASTETAEGTMREPNPYFVTEYESGWYVEKADPKDVNKSTLIYGPLNTQADAEMIAKAIRNQGAAGALYAFAAKLRGE